MISQNSLLETDLLDGCLARERRSMELFYRQYLGQLWGIASRYARDDLDTREILNTSFLKIFDALSSFDPNRPIQPWLKTIVMRTGLDAIRARHRHEPFQEEINHAMPIFFEKMADDAFSQAEILEKLRQLPEMQRSVLILFAIDGFSHREIAEKLAISENHARWYLHDARIKFKKIWQNAAFLI